MVGKGAAYLCRLVVLYDRPCQSRQLVQHVFLQRTDVNILHRHRPSDNGLQQLIHSLQEQRDRRLASVEFQRVTCWVRCYGFADRLVENVGCEDIEGSCLRFWGDCQLGTPLLRSVFFYGFGRTGEELEDISLEVCGC